MNPAQRCHIMKLPVDQLCTLPVGQFQVIFLNIGIPIPKSILQEEIIFNHPYVFAPNPR